MLSKSSSSNRVSLHSRSNKYTPLHYLIDRWQAATSTGSKSEIKREDYFNTYILQLLRTNDASGKRNNGAGKPGHVNICNIRAVLHPGSVVCGFLTLFHHTGNLFHHFFHRTGTTCVCSQRTTKYQPNIISSWHSVIPVDYFEPKKAGAVFR